MVVEGTVNAPNVSFAGVQWLATTSRARPARQGTGPFVVDLTDADGPDWYVEYFLNAANWWDPLLVSRVKHHFDVFELARLYEDQSADELVGIAE